MKIIKKTWSNPTLTMNLWLIPTMTYVIQKSIGVIRPDREWIWWIGLPCAVALWFVINFKISKK